MSRTTKNKVFKLQSWNPKKLFYKSKQIIAQMTRIRVQLTPIISSSMPRIPWFKNKILRNN